MQKKLEKESKTQSKPARPTLSSFLAQPATPFPFLPHRPKPRQPSSHPVFSWPSPVLRPSKFRPRPTAHGPFSLAPARGWPSATRSSRLRPRLSPLSACASPLSPHCSPGPPVGSISHLRLPRARATTGISGRNHRGFPSLLPRRDPRRSPLNHHETPLTLIHPTAPRNPSHRLPFCSASAGALLHTGHATPPRPSARKPPPRLRPCARKLLAATTIDHDTCSSRIRAGHRRG